MMALSAARRLLVSSFFAALLAVGAASLSAAETVESCWAGHENRVIESEHAAWTEILVEYVPAAEAWAQHDNRVNVSAAQLQSCLASVM